MNRYIYMYFYICKYKVHIHTHIHSPYTFTTHTHTLKTHIHTPHPEHPPPHHTHTLTTHTPPPYTFSVDNFLRWVQALPFTGSCENRGGEGSIDAEFTVARQRKICQKVIRKYEQNFWRSGFLSQPNSRLDIKYKGVRTITQI
jgi:hypothetical protein